MKRLENTKHIRIILLAIVVICTILLIIPTLPSLKPIQTIDSPNYPISYAESSESNEKVPYYITDGNRLFIPKIGVETKILEGQTLDVLSKEEGVWREPDTAGDPKNEGNMTLAGHRFQYLPPNATTLYNLDKLQKDDMIEVYWEGQRYVYKITETFEVTPDEVWVKNSIEGVKELTIYTCTPIYTSEKRLVVKAIQVNS